MIEEQKKWLIIYILWLIPLVFGSIWILYFKLGGITDSEILLSYLCWPVGSIFALFVSSSFSKKTMMLFGILFAALSFLVIPFFPNQFFTLALSFFLYGVAVLFWVPFNIKYFSFSREYAATSSTVYFSLAGLLSIFLVVVGGLFFNNFGPQVFFLVAGLLYLLPAIFVFEIKDERFRQDIIDCFNQARGFRTLNFIEGTMTGVVAAGTVISLLYLKTPVYLSIFIAFVSFFSIIASFVMSRLSDASRKRKFYITIFAAATGIFTSLMSLVGDLFGWAIISSLRNFFSNLFFPFTTAIILDNKQELAQVMTARELFLNLGRIFGIGIAALSQLALSDVRLSFFFLGILIFAYPIIVNMKRKTISVN